MDKAFLPWLPPDLITLIEQEVDQPSEAICLAALAPAIAIESGADTRNRKKVSGTSFFTLELRDRLAE